MCKCVEPPDVTVALKHLLDFLEIPFNVSPFYFEDFEELRLKEFYREYVRNVLFIIKEGDEVVIWNALNKIGGHYVVVFIDVDAWSAKLLIDVYPIYGVRIGVRKVGIDKIKIIDLEEKGGTIDFKVKAKTISVERERVYVARKAKTLNVHVTANILSLYKCENGVTYVNSYNVRKYPCAFFTRKASFLIYDPTNVLKEYVPTFYKALEGCLKGLPPVSVRGIITKEYMWCEEDVLHALIPISTCALVNMISERRGGVMRCVNNTIFAYINDKFVYAKDVVATRVEEYDEEPCVSFHFNKDGLSISTCNVVVECMRPFPRVVAYVDDAYVDNLYVTYKDVVIVNDATLLFGRDYLLRDYLL